MTIPAYTMSEDTISIFFEGRMHNIPRSDLAFNPLRELLKDGCSDPEEYSALLDRAKIITEYSDGLVTVSNNQVMFDGEVIHNTLTSKLVDMMVEGFDVKPWANFLANLMDNPSYKSRKSLYDFLDNFKTPITEDGHFLAFKRVRPDFKDIHSNSMDNSPGRVVRMSRTDVDDDSNVTCSSGLHACASSYLEGFANYGDNKTVVVKINPRDVVSVPVDYGFSKLRVCQYTVLSEAEEGVVEDLENSTYTDYDQDFDDEYIDIDDCWTDFMEQPYI